MCGIVGFWGEPDSCLLRSMAGSIRHRGPDDEGYFETDFLSLGHRRLSIIDLVGGHQPMSNEDDSLQLVYNGEVYNFRELRQELAAAGHRFRTDSDSEVIVHAFEEWGTEAFVRFNGMWAFALADVARRRLILCRDHFGVKPLYYARSSRRLLFASEIKALLQDPELRTAPNDQTIYEYLAYGLHDHKAETFFEGVFRLPAAHYAIVEAAEDGRPVFTLSPYWTPRLHRDGRHDPAEFRRLLGQAVRRRLVSDVPVGACLSGGLDSTTIVRLMNGLIEKQDRDARSLGARLETFSAVFDNDPIDERDYIAEAIKGTRAASTLIHPTPHDFVSELETFVWHQGEPVVSTGPYAQWAVMRGASAKVKVLLDGQGGDELLAGYVPYQMVYLRQLAKERRWALLLREALAASDVLWPLVLRRLRSRRRSRRIDERRLIRDEFRATVREPDDTRPRDDLKERLLQDLTTYSLPSLLRYEDHNSMAFSLESRVPFLDQELVDYVLALPPEALVRGGWSRRILREATRGILPERIRLRRWKVGFTTPEIRWLSNRRAVFTSLLASPQFQSRKYWNGEKVLETFRGACTGRFDNSMFFWRAINTELWLRVFFDKDGGVRREPPRSHIEAADRDWLAMNGLMGPAVAEATSAKDPAAGDTAPAQVAEWPGRAHAGKHVLSVARGRVWARLPVKTRLVGRGDDLADVIVEALDGRGATDRTAIPLRVRPGDILAVSEKIVAISQGRSFALAEIRPSRAARILSRFVNKNPHGIGVGRPETMELAIRTAGLPRILVAAAVGAVGKLLGLRGLFYDVAGPGVRAIDGPTAGTIPPYNGHAKMAPADPAGVAERLASELGRRTGVPVGVAVVDANDLSVEVLGASRGVDAPLIADLFRDNPLGQGNQQTPLAVLREVAPARPL